MLANRCLIDESVCVERLPERRHEPELYTGDRLRPDQQEHQYAFLRHDRLGS